MEYLAPLSIHGLQSAFLRLGGKGGIIDEERYIAPAFVQYLPKKYVDNLVRREVSQSARLLRGAGIKIPNEEKYTTFVKKSVWGRIPLDVESIRIYDELDEISTLGSGITGGSRDSESIYRSTLRKLYRGVSKNIPLDSHITDDYYAGNKNYRGTIFIFDLDKIEPLKDGEFMIVAIDRNPNDNEMAHFTSLYRAGTRGIFFNSYGIETPLQVLKYAKRSGCKEIDFSDTMYQEGVLNQRCGYYCIYVLDRLIESEDLKRTLATLRTGNPAYNNTILRRHFILDN